MVNFANISHGEKSFLLLGDDLGLLHDTADQQCAAMYSRNSDFGYPQVSYGQISRSGLATEINDNVEHLFCCETPKEAVEWAEEEATAQSVITWLVDAEDECEKFLKGKGYEVYRDKETAIDELEEEVLAAKVGKTETHSNVAPDVWAKVSELSAKHGWLHVLNLLEA